MKLLCDACHRLLPPASWEVENGTLRITCAGCGTTAVQSTTAAAHSATAGTTPTAET